jgi:hypothetical protein
VSVSFYDSDRGSYTVAVAWHRASGEWGHSTEEELRRSVAGVASATAAAAEAEARRAA